MLHTAVFRLLFCAGCIAMVTACAPPERNFAPGDDPADPLSVESVEDYREQRQVLRAELTAEAQTEAGNALACEAIPVGDKACGGPAEYVVFSTSASDTSRVRALAQHITRLDSLANAQLDLASDCMLVTRPRVLATVEGECVATAE